MTGGASRFARGVLLGGAGLVLTACGAFQFHTSTSGGAAPADVNEATAAEASVPETGPAPEGQSAPEDPIAAIGRLAVVDRLEGFTDDDSYDMDKVEAAFFSAEPDMFVHVADVRVKGTNGLHTYQPTPDHRLPRSSHGGEADYSIEWKHGRPVLTRRMAYPDLAPGTPVLVWSRRGEIGYVVVTTDGGRYRVSARALRPDKSGYEPTFVRGLGEPGRWPEGPQHTVLFVPDIEHFQKKGLVPADTSESFRNAQTRAKECAEKVWAAAEPTFQRIQAANVTRSTRQARLDQAKDQLTKQKNRRCSPHVDEARRVIDEAIEAYAERRRAMGKRVRARLQSLARDGSKGDTATAE